MNSEELQITQGADFHRTDVGNSQRLVLYHGDKIRYCSDIGAWYIWNGIRWERDEKGEIVQLAISVSEYMEVEAWQRYKGERYTEHVKWAKQSQQRRRIDDMIALASTDHATVVMASDLDSNPMLLNVRNGTLDLRTGDLGAHEPTDLITKLAPVAYDEKAECPKWQQFLHRVLNGNEELIAAMQQYVGACLAGNQAHVLFVCYGNGANGKTTFLETILAMLGDYAQKAPSGMLEAKQYTAIPNDIARLRGARFVVSNELNAHRRLDESLVKDLTGGDTITARYLRKEFFEFTPTHKLWVQGNNLPLIEGTDEGIWRRITLIPFEVTIPEGERNVRLREELSEELPGILTWAVKGYQEMLKVGKMEIPEVVRRASENYRRESDTIGQFLEEQCEEGNHYQVAVDILYVIYTGWSQSNGERTLSKNALGKLMKARGFTQSRSSSERRWDGIRIKRQG